MGIRLLQSWHVPADENRFIAELQAQVVPMTEKVEKQVRQTPFAPQVLQTEGQVVQLPSAVG